jgi:hypothetical protein
MSMDPRQLELAAEFCKVAGKANLVEYLGLEPGCTSVEALEQLKRRRRYMQGMQSNPKYKTEALLLIRNFSGFQALLGDPKTYLSETRRRAETTHLPVLEMTIRGALRGGALSPEQVDYLRRNAQELGVGDETFVGTLTRLVMEAGYAPPVSVPKVPAPPTDPVVPPPAGRSTGEFPGPPPIAPTVRTLSPSAPPVRPLALPGQAELEIADHYQVLGTTRASTRAEIREAWQERLRVARATLSAEDAARAIARFDQAWSVLADSGAREAYDLARKSTGPPARDREVTDPSGFRPSPLHAPTAPPVRQRNHAPRKRSSSGGGGDDDISGAYSVPAVAQPTSPPTPGTSGANVPRTFAPEGSRPTTHPGGPSRVEIAGADLRQIKVAMTPVTVPLRVQFSGDDTAARIHSDATWIIAEPSRIDGSRQEVEVAIIIDPATMPRNAADARVTVQTDKGEQAVVTFEVERVGSRGVPPAAIAAVVALILVFLLIAAYLVNAYVLMHPTASLDAPRHAAIGYGESA